LLYSFADCTLNTDRRELRRNGELVAVTPQVFDLLEYLVCNRERVVSKDDLIAAVWKGRIVSESALTTRINGVRCAIGDSGEEQRLIRTLARKGIRFVGTVSEERAPPPKPPERVERKLAAILAADVAGYSRLIGIDEEGTLNRLRELRKRLIDPKIATHQGRIVKLMGDGILIEFQSAVAALRCAVEIQHAIAEHNASQAKDRRIEFRVGIHEGDVVVENDDIFGDGVNVAARLQALAEPGTIFVSQRIHEDTAGKVDVTFEDMGDHQLKNIARRVRVYRVRLDRIPLNARPTLALPDKPSIAVLPFQNMSGDPEQEYFADGMVEEIITALSRIRWLFVIARNSSFTYKGRAVDVKQVGRELGVRYVLEGSIRKSGDRVRITCQLIDAVSDAHLWADHFDGSLSDVFALQDKIAISVTGVIEPAVVAAEIRRSIQRQTTDLTVYDLCPRPRGGHVVGRDPLTSRT
jgi:adenylate cyclase